MSKLAHLHLGDEVGIQRAVEPLHVRLERLKPQFDNKQNRRKYAYTSARNSSVTKSTLSDYSSNSHNGVSGSERSKAGQREC